jgi:prepilin-type N-terminal cleavage/methylation domain-containing protein
MRNAVLAPSSSHSGFSLVDLMIVVALLGVLAALAIPQLVSTRRMIRSAAITREILTQLRYARQQAMTQRQVFTFQYDDSTKQILIIDHNSDPNTSGTMVLADPSYPNTANRRVVSTMSLASGGVPSAEIIYGIPTGLPTSALSDGVSRTNLTSGKLNVAFQPDGSVVDVNGNPVNTALFFYNSKAGADTACAISVLGAAGRVKLWRYDVSVNRYVE